MTKENMAQENLSQAESSEAKNDVKFFVDSIDRVSDALSRYAIATTPDSFISKDSIISGKDEEIAKVLSGLEVIDPAFEKLDFESDEGLTKGAELLAAKEKSLSRELNDSEATSRLEEFKNRILMTIGKAIASADRKKSLAGASALALLITSCTPSIAENVSTNIKNDQNVGSGPVMSEPILVNKEVSSQKSVTTPEGGIDTNPTSVPGTKDVDTENEDSEEIDISELARKIQCLNPKGECVTESFLLGTDIINASVSAVSTGRVGEIEVYNPNTNQLLARASTVEFVTRDSDGNPQIVEIVVQLIPVGEDGRNVYSEITNYAAGNYSDIDNKNPYTKEDLERFFSRGRQFDFGFSTTDVFGEHQDWEASSILGSYYDAPGYSADLEKFVDSRGSNLPPGTVVFPTTISSLVIPGN